MDRFGNETQIISLIIMAHAIGLFAFSGVTGWLIDKVGRKLVMTEGSVILIAACIHLPLSDEVLLLGFALFLLGLAWNF